MILQTLFTRPFSVWYYIHVPNKTVQLIVAIGFLICIVFLIRGQGIVGFDPLANIRWCKGGTTDARFGLSYTWVGRVEVSDWRKRFDSSLIDQR